MDLPVAFGKVEIKAISNISPGGCQHMNEGTQ